MEKKVFSLESNFGLYPRKDKYFSSKAREIEIGCLVSLKKLIVFLTKSKIFLLASSFIEDFSKISNMKEA